MAVSFTHIPIGKYREFLPDFTEEKTRAFTTLTLTLLTFSILGFFAIQPSVATIAQLRKELDDSKIVKTRLDEKIKNLATLQGLYFQIEQRLPTLYDAVPTEPETALLVGQLQAIAKNEGVTLTNLNVLEVELARKKEADTPQSTYLFTLDATGSYDQLLSFLTLLTNYQRIVTIDALSFTQTDDATGGYRISIRGVAYFKK